ncbi:CoA transferase [Mycobacteroides salmoniphilum]|uniref:E-cinnamoyl-CoA:R-phenyllactate CoA transferase n=1 Tax=Mycobacteroides salmoniphilum TaxID=404941 RepID=A0A4R8SEF9_9MYCO|nr:CoA transferase [Mycobacteroides salmoniphilum]TDZ94560.1 E-cinnamoyl-CoA:R-phenyllactate CoA transferase [Mycobacteroides salmoniphilum]TEA00892.1 E-cinnamoyl-CoA:R-phenyllactate CoA transferase [Mycobacteroides salmoniphilum]
MSLDKELKHVLASPATSDDYDLHEQLEKLLNDVGLASSDSGGSIRFIGSDPIIPSFARYGAASALPLVARAVAIAKIWQLRGGPGQDIEVDLRRAIRRFAAFYEFRWETLNGVAGAGGLGGWETLSRFFTPTRDDRWVSLVNPYPRLGAAAATLLDCPPDHKRVQAAVLKWDARDLEEAAGAAGVVMPMVRSFEEFMAEEQYRALTELPLIEIRKIGDSAPEPLPWGGRAPLDGIRALGMGNALAGATVGRSLALHGADVLNIWRPHQLELELWYINGQTGVRSTILDPADTVDAQRIRSLAKEADIFYANRRPGYLERHGLSAEDLAELRPGIIYGANSAYGRTGPWANRVGFDVAAGTVTGFYEHEGEHGVPATTPVIGIVNDNIVAWLLSLGITAALIRRAEEGGSYRIDVSLARTALWMQSLGIFDKEYARETAGSAPAHTLLVPEQFRVETPLGHYVGVTEQVRMSRTPGFYRHVLLARGSCPPEWLDSQGSA